MELTIDKNSVDGSDRSRNGMEETGTSVDVNDNTVDEDRPNKGLKLDRSVFKKEKL